MKTNMKTKKMTTWLMIVTIMISLALPGLSVQAQRPQRTQQPKGRGTGRTVNSFRVQLNDKKSQSLQTLDGTRPAWVQRAIDSSVQNLEAQRDKFGLGNVKAELKLLGAEQDDLGMAHLRLSQTHHDIEVFGSQLIAHVEGEAIKQIGGRSFEVSKIDTTPVLSSEQAIDAAKTSLNYTGEFSQTPTANLVILPHRIFEQGANNEASLTWQVALQIEDGTDATASHQYFVDARDGHIVWHYDSMPKDGIGNSLYSGTVNVKTFWLLTYFMTDTSHGNSKVFDMGIPSEPDGLHFTDRDNIWGDGTTGNRQSAAVDVQFGVGKTWDYFYNILGRNGMDGNGGEVISKVHVGLNWNNATKSPGNNVINFGDGDGVRFNPLVSVDIVAHEFTHGITERTANLIYANESGALNESFSDIFGTAVEYYTGIAPDYLIGEDCFTPGVAGDAMRSMSNPATQGHPDHYSNRYLGTNDSGGVHTNSGIMNNAFYLLAEGGTNSTSNLTVKGIGRNSAQAIFWRALAYYLFPSANFYDARLATVNAAADLFGAGSQEHRSTEAAWDAVGVSGPQLLFYNADNGNGSLMQVTPDGSLNQLTSFPASFALGWTDIIPTKNHEFFYNWRTGLYAVTKIDQNGGIATLSWNYAPTYLMNVVSTDNHLFFYRPSDRSGLIGRVTPAGQFEVTQSIGAGAFGAWTNIVDTQYGMFFYSSTEGTVAVCYVNVNGQLVPTDAKLNYLPAGYDRVVAEGAKILLYNTGTGRYTAGSIDSAGKFQAQLAGQCAATLQPGYRMVVAADGKFFLYNPDNGAAVVASITISPYVECSGELRINKIYAPYTFGLWDNLTPTNNGLVFYKRNGYAAVGRFQLDGSFIMTAGYYGTLATNWSHVVRTEK